jgi:uncharacterized spore protein YtfJ
MEHVRTLIEALTPRLEQMVRIETIVGEAIEVRGKTLIPLMRASYGVFGGGVAGHGEGAGHGKVGMEGKGEGKGGGTGGGLKLEPAAIICIDDSGVSVFPIEKAEGLAGAIAEIAPQIINKLADASADSDSDDQ